MTTEATDLSSAIADLFRPAASQPAPADAIAQHAALMARLGASAIADASTMHAQALEHNPHLSAQFRTAECARDVAEIASMHTRAPIEDCLRQYARRIASTLGPDAPAARRVLDALDAEQRELDAAAARAEQDRAAAAAAEEARRAEVRAKREERKDRIAEAAQAEQTARAGYEAAVRTHQRIRAEALRERVAESGLSEVRDHLGRLWSVKDLILVGGDGTAELPPHYEMGVLERALDKYEAS